MGAQPGQQLSQQCTVPSNTSHLPAINLATNHLAALRPRDERCGARLSFILPAVPFIVGAKLAGLFVAKKVAFLALLRVYGVKRTFKALHTINEKLLHSGEEGYSNTSFEAVKRGLNDLEAAISTLNEAEQVREVWAWFESIGKNNPTFFAAFTKTFMMSSTPYKWMRTVMDDAPKSGENEPVADSPAGSSWRLPDDVHDALCEELLANARPEIRERYHLLLVPKQAES